MGRIRTIKPDFYKNDRLSSLPEGTHLLAGALLNYSDDEGYFNANPELIKAECCPLREPSVSIPGSLRELSRIGYLRLGEFEGRTYGHIINFLDHQKVSHPTPSKIKKIKINWGFPPEDSLKAPEMAAPEDSLRTHGSLRPELKGFKDLKEKNIPPINAPLIETQPNELPESNGSDHSESKLDNFKNLSFDEKQKITLDFYNNLPPPKKQSFYHGAIGLREHGEPIPPPQSSRLYELMAKWYETTAIGDIPF